MTMAAVGLSIAGSLQCQFLLVDITTGTGWDLILGLIPDGLNQVWVGIFQWGPAINGNLAGECRYYDDFFNGGDQYYLEVAQICAIVAPVIGFIGILISCFELICCSFFGSCIFACIFFFAAAGVQMGTFGLFASPGWCTDLSSGDCYDNNVDKATFWMLLLSGAFFLFSSFILCCAPRPDPCLQNRSARDPGDASKVEHDAEEVEAPEITPSHSGGGSPHYVETY